MKVWNPARAAVWGIAGLLATVSGAQAEKKPNFLFIFADDMSYSTISAHGMLDIDTPHLDTLVDQGASFTHAYNMGAWNGAVCVASRAMLNTGRFLWQAHQTDQHEHMNNNRMWAQRMKAAGYETYMSGKWHLKIKPQGVFDVAENVRGGMPNQTAEGYNRPKDEEDYRTGWKPWDPQYGGFWRGGTHWSEVLGNDGVSFLKQAAETDQPFFMYLAFNAPHDPRQSPKEYVDRYPLSRIKLPENFLPEYPHAEAICGKQLRDERLMPYPRTEYAVKINLQEYYAIITHMDDQIGRILETLKETGQAGNTYIVFTADHGLAVGRHGLVGKQNQYDHSVRVPFLIIGPGIEAGSSVSNPIYLQDAMATALDIAGASQEGVDFKSVMPLLKQEEAEHYPAIYGAYTGTQRMITKNGWKLIVYPTINVERLYHVEKDPLEMNDLINNPEYKAKRDELSAALAALSEELDDPILKEPAPEPENAVFSTVDVAGELPAGALRLRAAHAELKTDGEQRIVYRKDRDSLGSWFYGGDWVEWQVKAAPGLYTLVLEGGSVDPSVLEVSLGDEQLVEYRIPPSGDYKTFKRYELGKVLIDDGPQKLSLKPAENGWRPINLRSVTLIPAK